MSRVYFHTPSGTAELSGAERAHFGLIVTDIGMQALGVSDRYPFDNDKFAAALTPRQHTQYLETAMRAGEIDLALRLPDGSRHTLWILFLNAVLAVGNDALCLAARVHAQCEVHGWIAPSDREWAAATIEAGRATGLYRSGVGWEDIVNLLRSSRDEPVVLSYSVCDMFPSRDIPGIYERIWCRMSSDDRWSAAWGKLKDRSDLRICKDGVLFDSGVNAFQAHDAITGWSERWAKDKA
jgi:hypothetical protein